MGHIMGKNLNDVRSVVTSLAVRGFVLTINSSEFKRRALSTMCKADSTWVSSIRTEMSP